MTDLTPSQTAAAFHGLATNPAHHSHQRLSFALKALDLYEAEVERLRGEVQTLTPAAGGSESNEGDQTA